MVAMKCRMDSASLPLCTKSDGTYCRQSRISQRITLHARLSSYLDPVNADARAGIYFKERHNQSNKKVQETPNENSILSFPRNACYHEKLLGVAHSCIAFGFAGAADGCSGCLGSKTADTPFENDAASLSPAEFQLSSNTPPCPIYSLTTCRDATDQTNTLLSNDPDARYRPSGLNAIV
mmetsp:Transcript_8112/g.17486  ORF Transcript_8112/g.17486 Transcript_8112/m.17486 type:complete len:179 (-) Transcript_8112:111-647(-)